MASHILWFTTSSLATAQSANRRKSQMNEPRHPSLRSASSPAINRSETRLLFQVFSRRYETDSTIVPTNQAYERWATELLRRCRNLRPGPLDHLLHHAETVRSGKCRVAGCATKSRNRKNPDGIANAAGAQIYRRSLRFTGCKPLHFQIAHFAPRCHRPPHPFSAERHRSKCSGLDDRLGHHPS